MAFGQPTKLTGALCSSDTRFSFFWNLFLINLFPQKMILKKRIFMWRKISLKWLWVFFYGVKIILSIFYSFERSTKARYFFEQKRFDNSFFHKKKLIFSILNQRNGNFNPFSAWKRIKVEDELEKAVFVEVLDLCAVIRHWLQHFSIDKEYRKTNGTRRINF